MEHSRGDVGHALTDLISAAYGAAGSEKGWEQFVRRLCAVTGAELAGFTSLQAGPGVPRVTWALGSSHPAESEARAGNGAARRAGPVLNEVVVAGSGELSECPEARLETWTRAHGGVSAGGRLLFSDAGGAGEIGWFYRHRPMVDGETARQFARQLFPHVQRAIDLHYRIARVELERDVTRRVFDFIPQALVLLGANHRVIATNRAARDLLARGDGLSRVGGALRADDWQTDVRLQRMIRTATAAGASDPIAHGGCLRVPRTDRSPYEFVILPLAPEVSRETELAAAVAFLGDPDGPAVSADGLFRRLYNLSPAESRIVAHLLDGRSPKEIALELGVSVETIRSHIKSVFRKTDTSRQVDLVRLLLRSPTTLHAA